MNRYHLGDKICFFSGYPGAKFLSHGWSTPEQHHCWSDGSQAEISFQIVSLLHNDLLLYICCQGFLAGGLIDHQDVDLYVNEQFLTTWKVSSLKWFDLTIPRNLIGSDCIIIKFIINQPLSPFEHNLSLDKRKLGISLNYMVLFDNVDINHLDAKKISMGKDPIGYVYKSKNCYFRLIRKDLNIVKDLVLNTGLVNLFSKEKMIPSHFFKSVKHDQYQHIAFSTTGIPVYPPNYPILMLRDAAYTFISINEILLDYFPEDEFGLLDGHYGNFVQMDNAIPMWCDIGSISNVKSHIEFGYGQFVRCYVRPLIMFSIERNIPQIRNLMHKSLDGISMETAIQISGDIEQLRVSETYPQHERRQALASLRLILDQLGLNPQKERWSDYRNEEALMLAYNGKLLQENYDFSDSRFKAVIDLALKFAAGAYSFIDIGCNDGVFSLLLAREGLKGLAIDLDEYALNKLYLFVRKHDEISLKIACNSFMSVAEQAELVLALALTHHLYLSQNISFDQIAEKLSKISTKFVITEFMPDGQGGILGHPQPHPNPLPEEYCLSNFTVALEKYFNNVEIIDYLRKTDPKYFSRRILIFCQK
ncbi:class I SAM-dependent methyltransferase [Limnospira platensis]|uniref:class I SAM-dependent methyltransferase n=1 Tax=Limnospira platensis TaxID=118562 RepID=UPI003D6FDCCE